MGSCLSRIPEQTFRLQACGRTLGTPPMTGDMGRRSRSSLSLSHPGVAGFAALPLPEQPLLELIPHWAALADIPAVSTSITADMFAIRPWFWPPLLHSPIPSSALRALPQEPFQPLGQQTPGRGWPWMAAVPSVGSAEPVRELQV